MSLGLVLPRQRPGHLRAAGGRCDGVLVFRGGAPGPQALSGLASVLGGNLGRLELAALARGNAGRRVQRWPAAPRKALEAIARTNLSRS
eukprot:1098460-Pyramimonas_sp.AAC.1